MPYVGGNRNYRKYDGLGQGTRHDEGARTKPLFLRHLSIIRLKLTNIFHRPHTKVTKTKMTYTPFGYETERLVVRNADCYEETTKRAIEIYTHPLVMKMGGDLLSRSDVHQIILHSALSLEYFKYGNGYVCMSISLKESKEIIGFCQINNTDRDQNIYEIGYHLHPYFWNKGYATELLASHFNFICIVSGSDARCSGTVQAHIEDDNIASARVLLKNNFVLIGEGKGGFNKRPMLTYERSF